MHENSQPVLTGALLIIDQESIRSEARDELSGLYGRIRRMREQIGDFESVDRPAFARWLRIEFHEQLSEIAKLQARLMDAEELVSEVQMIRFATGCSYYQAYLNAMERRRTGESFKEFTGFEFDESDEDDFHVYEDDEDEGKSRRSKRSESEDEARGEDEDEGGAFGHGPRGSQGREESDEGLFKSAKKAETDVGESLKARYRELARLLHPDLRSGGDDWSNDLWHRTQEAYQRGDLQELENLLVMCRMSFGDDGDDSTVWEMRNALGFLKRSLTSLKRQIGQLRHDMAWGFSRLKDKTKLRRRISYDLDHENEDLSERLEAMEGQLARWSVPPAPRKPRAKRRSSWDIEI